MLRLFIFIGLALVIATAAQAATILVPGDHATIQEAIEAAEEGDTVLVSAGTYVENIDFLGMAITVASVDGAATTIIDGNALASVVTFALEEGSDSVLEGFTITNGFSDDGGGVFCDFYSEPTLKNLIVTSNEAFNFGGGIFAKHGSPVIQACEVSDNTAWNGGGIACYFSSATITDTLVHDNDAEGFGGGGIYCFNQAEPEITNTAIYNNSAFNGGGVAIWGSDPIITNSVVYGNSVVYSGGGLFLYSESYPTVTNSILWSNAKTQIAVSTGGNAIVTYSCIQNGYSGQNNITANPQFVNVNDGDFHILSASPCIDKGKNAAEALPEKDIDGDDRIINSDVDMGYDEYATFAVDVAEISIAAGGTATFSLSPGASYQGRTYLVLAGVTGTSPGTPLPGGMATLPLNWDAVTDFVLSTLWLPVYQGFTGTIDTAGMATAQLIVPNTLPGNVSGAVLYFAYTLNNPFDFASNPVQFTFVD